MVSALSRKLARDLRRQRGQVVSIALLVACAVMAIVGMRSTYDSLQWALDDYYSRYHFADVFATLTRAPESVARRVRALSGVDAVETRVVSQATLNVRGLEGTAVAQIVSLPERGRPRLNDVHVFAGRYIRPGRDDEVLASVRFAAANSIAVGDTLTAVINGRWKRLRVVGIASSPDFLYEIAGSAVFVDSRRFAILWMARDALAPAAGITGSFNSLSLTLARGAREERVIGQLDAILAPYGSLGAIGRALQPSAEVLTDELHQVSATATVFPFFFLGIAAFLLNVVLARLIATQRGEIGTLKAFGYSDRAVAAHFLAFACGAVLLGTVLGIAGGVWLGHAFTGLYDDYFGFPNLAYRTRWSTVLVGVGVSGGAAFGGALVAIRSVAQLPPAAAMRPEAPAKYRRTILEAAGLRRVLSPANRATFRALERRPLRTAASVIGIALACAVLIAGIYPFDAVDRLIDNAFRRAQREDLSVAFTGPRSAAVRAELTGVRGVARVELSRVTMARVRKGSAVRTVAMRGIERGGTLRRLVDSYGNSYGLPVGGAVLSRAVADLLGARIGDSISVNLMERGVRRTVLVSGVLDESIGLNVYVERRALNRLLDEGDLADGAVLTVEAGMSTAVTEDLRSRPAVAAIASRRALIDYFQRTFADSVLLSGSVVIFAAVVIAVGVVYNGARITLSERARELASLRVLGFTRREVSGLFLAEQGAITVAGLPLGAAFGLLFAAILASAFGSERHRFPVMVDRTTYLFSTLVVVTTSAIVALAVRRRLDHLDLIAALKTED